MPELCTLPLSGLLKVPNDYVPLSLVARVKAPLQSSPLSEKLPTSVPLKNWPSGLHSVWVPSPSFDLETWFQNLKNLGNQESAMHAAMFILLSGVQSFVSVSPKLTISKALHWKSLSLSSLAPPYVPLLPSEHCWPLVMPVPTSPWFPGLGGHQPFMLPSPNLSNLQKMGELAPLDTSCFKEYGHPIPILDIYPGLKRTPTLLANAAQVAP